MRKKIRKIAALALSVALVTGCISGCTDEEGTNGTNGSAASGSGAVSSNGKKTFEDLGGMDILIGDWYTEEINGEKTEYQQAQQDYYKEIQDTYNFTIKRESAYAYEGMQAKFVNDVMANNPTCQIYCLYQETVSAPLMKGLMRDLSKLPEFDFKEEKWNPTVTELMTIGDGIWGMSVEREPRGGIFYNKRLFKEAGIPEEEPYDLQASNQWTWEKFEEYCKRLTKDTDGDGKTDQYAMASFSKYYLPMCAATNDATFIDRKEDGKYESAIGTQNFKDAMIWGIDMMKKGYVMPKPQNASAWDWYKAAFRDGEVAMQTSETYEITSFADMKDDWGFVMFPYNQKNKNATNRTIPNDNIFVMPSCYDDATAEKIAFAFDLYTEPLDNFSADEAYCEQYYNRFRDDRAVDETLMMMKEKEHKQTSYLPMITNMDLGEYCYGVYALAETPSKKIEELSSKWEQKVKKVNEEYEKFAREHQK